MLKRRAAFPASSARPSLPVDSFARERVANLHGVVGRLRRRQPLWRPQLVQRQLPQPVATLNLGVADLRFVFIGFSLVRLKKTPEIRVPPWCWFEFGSVFKSVCTLATISLPALVVPGCQNREPPHKIGFAFPEKKETDLFCLGYHKNSFQINN